MNAIEHIRPMSGGSQSHLLKADDGNFYVVKALNNPQHRRILANEWLASSIARAIGLSIPHFDWIEFDAAFTERFAGFRIRLNGQNVFPESPAFASRLAINDPLAPIYDYLPEPALGLIENMHEFAGVFLIDKWLCNCDGRQVVFCRPHGRLKAFFIDFGFCFNAGDWDFPDSALRGLHTRNRVYDSVTGWESFEPWLSRIESFSFNKLLNFIARMPLEWNSEPRRLVELLDGIYKRRKKLRDLIDQTRLSARAPFSNWQPMKEPHPLCVGLF